MIAVDGASTEHITTQGIASHRLEIVVSGRAATAGLTSARPIPSPPGARHREIFERSRSRRSSQLLQLRHHRRWHLGQLDSVARRRKSRSALRTGIRSRQNGTCCATRCKLACATNSPPRMNVRRTANHISFPRSRARGENPDNAPLVETIRNVDRFLGNRSRLERSSTDANIPLSLGVPAVSLDGGGKGWRLAHSRRMVRLFGPRPRPETAVPRDPDPCRRATLTCPNPGISAFWPSRGLSFASRDSAALQKNAESGVPKFIPRDRSPLHWHIPKAASRTSCSRTATFTRWTPTSMGFAMAIRGEADYRCELLAGSACFCCSAGRRVRRRFGDELKNFRGRNTRVSTCAASSRCRDLTTRICILPKPPTVRTM